MKYAKLRWIEFITCEYFNERLSWYNNQTARILLYPTLCNKKASTSFSCRMHRNVTSMYLGEGF